MRRKNMGRCCILLAGLFLTGSIFTGCGRSIAEKNTETPTEPVISTESVSDTVAVTPILNPDGNTLETRFSTPEGYHRITCEKGSFGTFLREYPLYEDGAQVHLYDGSLKGNQEDHAAIFQMELADGDLQQCADSVLRLYAEYFFQTKQYSRMHFRLTNGFELSFDNWRKGMRVSVDGNETNWVSSADASNSEETFKSYLQFLFCYAGTLSMGQECSQAELSDVQAGDIFLYSGSPGHVVLVLDVCENENGQRAFLLGQGYMPAQQFHVLKNPADEDNPWYYTDEITYPFSTPEYTFDEESFMRPKY